MVCASSHRVDPPPWVKKAASRANKAQLGVRTKEEISLNEISSAVERRGDADPREISRRISLKEREGWRAFDTRRRGVAEEKKEKTNEEVEDTELGRARESCRILRDFPRAHYADNN